MLCDDNDDDMFDDDNNFLLPLFKRHPVKLSKPKIFLDISQLVKVSPTSRFKFFPIINNKDDHCITMTIVMVKMEMIIFAIRQNRNYDDE